MFACPSLAARDLLLRVLALSLPFTVKILLLLLLFLTFSVLVANPKKLLYTVANSARSLLNRENKTKQKVALYRVPNPRPAKHVGVARLTFSWFQLGFDPTLEALHDIPFSSHSNQSKHSSARQPAHHPRVPSLTHVVFFTYAHPAVTRSPKDRNPETCRAQKHVWPLFLPPARPRLMISSPLFCRRRWDGEIRERCFPPGLLAAPSCAWLDGVGVTTSATLQPQ